MKLRVRGWEFRLDRLGVLVFSPTHEEPHQHEGWPEALVMAAMTIYDFRWPWVRK